MDSNFDQLRYRDREEAGKILGTRIPARFHTANTVVLALPRGGVPVGFEVARTLDAPLDAFVVRKLGAPRQPELAIGAIASGGYEVLNRPLIAHLGISELEIAKIFDRETNELHRREAAYRDDRPATEVRGHTVILVDDGLATGFTMKAAIMAIRDQGAARLVVAVPVGPLDTCEEIARLADTLICPLQPTHFEAVGLWYDKFPPTSDDEVRECLMANHAHVSRGGHEPWR